MSMRTAIGEEPVTRSQLVLAAVLLAGVLVLAYGYFHPSRVAFHAGVFLTAAGVVAGIVRIITRGGGGKASA